MGPNPCVVVAVRACSAGQSASTSTLQPAVQLPGRGQRHSKAGQRRLGSLTEEELQESSPHGGWRREASEGAIKAKVQGLEACVCRGQGDPHTHTHTRLTKGQRGASVQQQSRWPCRLIADTHTCTHTHITHTHTESAVCHMSQIQQPRWGSRDFE